MIRIARFILPLLLAASARAFEPTDAYTPREIDGFRVLIHRDALARTNEFAEAEVELKRQLDFVTNVLPAKAVATLRGVTIWLESAAKKGGGAEFHPSRDWLVAHDYNPEKTRCVEISNLRHFVDWSRRTQPCMVLHELAHAYHFIVLGGDFPPVRAAYKRAKDAGLYDSVEFIQGGKKRHYALTDDKEFFAELSESYFGKNDFYPFTRDQLATHDPDSLAVIQSAWQTPPIKTAGR